jgi:hypothetical protein
MVSIVRVAPIGIVLGIAVFASAQAQRSSDPSLVCVNATRDWNEYGAAQSLEVARDFLSRRVRPECRGLAQRVLGRIAVLERVRPRIRIATAAPRPEPRPVRQSRPVLPASQLPDAAGPPRGDDRYYERRLASPPAQAVPSIRQPTNASAYEIRQPNWFDVIERYPDLRALFDRGGPDLCARCLVGASGYLGSCRVAGAAAADPAIRDGARRMISMIQVRRRDGASAAGASFRIPAHFGRLMAPPPGGYCSNHDADFR